MSNFYKDTMNIPIIGAEYGFNGVVVPEYARGHRAALIAASKIALDADVRVNSLETDLAGAKAEITRLREGRKIHNCEAAEAQISALEKDAAMLDWLADHEAVKNINRVNLSIYETAQCIAYERDVDAEPTVEDYRLALRLMIRTAINAEAAHSGEGEKR